MPLVESLLLSRILPRSGATSLPVEVRDDRRALLQCLELLIAEIGERDNQWLQALERWIPGDTARECPPESRTMHAAVEVFRVAYKSEFGIEPRVPVARWKELRRKTAAELVTICEGLGFKPRGRLRTLKYHLIRHILEIEAFASPAIGAGDIPMSDRRGDQPLSPGRQRPGDAGRTDPPTETVGHDG